jgi:hypothetical protein
MAIPITSTNEEQAEVPASLMGIRISIWEVVFVMIGGGFGSLAGGSIYSLGTVLGAFIGASLGPGSLRWLLSKKSHHR